MRSSIEALEGNNVKVRVEVDEDEFETAVDEAFRAIAKEELAAITHGEPT